MSEHINLTITNELNSYCNQWFIAKCCWNIPDLKQIEPLDEGKKKALISKGVIGLRQCLENNNKATKAFPQDEIAVIRTQLEVIALKYGYAQEEKTEAINLDLKKAVAEHKENLAIIETLNTNMGARVAAGVMLCNNAKEVANARSCLSILTLTKRVEPAILQGSIRCGMLKTAIVMSKELRRTEYEPVVDMLAKDLRGQKQKIEAVLERIPAGVIGKHPIKQLISDELKEAEGQTSETVHLIHSFDFLTQVYCDVNTSLANRLAAMVTPIEKEHGIISIVPVH